LAKPLRRLALIGLLAAAAPGAWAQAAKPVPAMKTVGVFALLGDSVQVTASDTPAATRLEVNARDTLDFKGIGFDLIALRTARDEIRRVQPAAQVAVFRGPDALSVSQQRAVAAGAAKAELPAWLVKTIDENALTHLLLVTRSRGTIDAATTNGHSIGRGTVDGIGFYIDTLYSMRNTTTGAMSTGLLAPYMQVKLTLMDAQSGEIVASYDVKDAYAYASPETQAKADPWSFMPPAEKIKCLRELVEAGIQRGTASLLHGS
jgi:hypothetical protein